MAKKMNEVYERTNVFIINPDIWIESKKDSEMLGYKSVSNYLFKLLEMNKENKYFYHTLLFELEKYFEMEYYTLSTVAEKTDLDTEIIIKIMINNLGFKFIDKNEKENIKIIHTKLIENNLLPRELSFMLSLKKKFQRKDELNSRELLEIFFPNPSDRKAELLTYTNNLIFEAMKDKEFKNYCNKCNKFDNCNNDDLSSILYELNIEFTDELFDDPLIEEVSKKNLLKLYGSLLIYSAEQIIEQELDRLEEMKLEDVILLEDTFLGKLTKQKEIYQVKLKNKAEEYGLDKIQKFNKEILIP